MEVSILKVVGGNVDVVTYTRPQFVFLLCGWRGSWYMNGYRRYAVNSTICPLSGHGWVEFWSSLDRAPAQWASLVEGRAPAATQRTLKSFSGGDVELCKVRVPPKLLGLWPWTLVSFGRRGGKGGRFPLGLREHVSVVTPFRAAAVRPQQARRAPTTSGSLWLGPSFLRVRSFSSNSRGLLPWGGSLQTTADELLVFFLDSAPLFLWSSPCVSMILSWISSGVFARGTDF